MIVGNHQTLLRSHSLFITVLTRALLIVFLYKVILHFLPNKALPDVNILVEYFRRMVFPKSTERFIFLFLCVVLPIYSLLLIQDQEKSGPIAFSKLLSYELPLIVATVLFLPLVGSDYLILLEGKKFARHPNVLLFWCGLASIISCLFYARWKKPLMAPELTRAFSWVMYIASLLLTIVSWRVVNTNWAAADGSWSVHADIAFYATSQVVAGKTILVDLPSQYGLFPEIIAPLFKLIGLNVFNFSFFFAILQFTSMTGLFYVLARSIKNSGLLLITGFSLLVVTFTSMLYFSGIIDRYFQYWPVRFFWPAISVLVFYHFARNQNIKNSAFVSFVGAIGAIWVMDTGVFIVFSYAIFLAAKGLVLRLPVKHLSKVEALKESNFYLKSLAIHIGITIGTIAVFLGILLLKSHQLLHLSWLFSYQKVFYGLGFMMLPMPLFAHPWMSMVCIYLFGIIAALLTWHHHKDHFQTDLIFYISTLGLGIFIYYEGRSHIFNLVTVTWPALMIIAITVDSILNRIRKRELPLTEIWIPIVSITLLYACTTNFMYNVPKMFKDARFTIKTRHLVRSPVIADEIDFIKKYTKIDQCLILTQRQGIYYAESGAASPIKGPGIVEMVLQKDLDELNQHIRAADAPCIILGTGPFSIPFVLGKLAKFNKKYEIAAENKAHTLYYLRRKSDLS